jgi:hypothetical protein
MKTNEYIDVNTHAELLNELLGTSYQAWGKSSIVLPDGKRIWMIQLKNEMASSGWRNKLVSENRIEEEQEAELQFSTHATARSGKYGEDRIVFDIIKMKNYRRYIFRGVFRINNELCTPTKNVWDKISDEYLF